MRMLPLATALLTIASPAAAQSVVVTHTTQGGYIPYAPPPPQDGPYLPYEPLPTDAEVFGGLRIEAQLGFDRIGGDDQVLFDSNDGSRNGLTYGGEAGFDVPVGRAAVIGGYVGVAGSTAEDCIARIGATTCSRAPLSLTAGGRIGFVVGGGTLLYGKGGYTRGRIESDSIRTTNPPSTVSLRQNLDGYHVGGGIEQQFGRTAYGKVEYVYTRLRDFNATTLPGADQDFNRHQVKVGLGLRI